MGRFAMACLVLAELLIVQMLARVGEAIPATDPQESGGAAEAPVIRKLFIKNQFHDRSEIGGGVIICGLITATFAVVFYYIRATRKRSIEDH
ncbi:hypothetical protein Nepgr_000489 [Nepenthes gracilis]|uniref:Uncharacterized protein n=1 Tax=Nepenthes gracilis TaxID=150966 RepID=A0AAD3P1V0_NEPGR|nr:hypothetical protein Nepgr_000489 [Nepenthes gracilis]